MKHKLYLILSAIFLVLIFNFTLLTSLAAPSTNPPLGGVIQVNTSAPEGSLILDATGAITTGIWKATALGISYGGTGSTQTGDTNCPGASCVTGIRTNLGLAAAGSNSDITSLSPTGNLILTPTGNVGIGTTSPQAKLHVGTASTQNAYTYGIANGDGLLFNFYNDGATTYTRHADIVSSAGDNSAADIKFFTKAAFANPLERVRIDSAGNVGIGITDPTAKLETAGGHIKFTGPNYNLISTSTRTGTYCPGGVCAQGDVIQIGPYLKVDGTGPDGDNVLKLKTTVNGWIIAPSDNATYPGEFKIIDANNNRRLSIHQAADGDVLINPEGGGNVGIGTATPGTYKLNVNGNTNITGNLTVSGTCTGCGGGQWTASGTNIYNANSGNVGIGTTLPRSALDTNLGVMSGAANDYLKGQFSMSGGGTVTWSGGKLKWTGRFIAIPMSRVTTTWGYIDMNQPTTNIPASQVYDGIARSADSTGVSLLGWDALYAVHTPGGTGGEVSYYIVRYTTAFNAPSNWLLVGAVNGDDNTIKLGTGLTLKNGGSYAAGTDAQYASVSTPISVANGGTGATTASGARTNLGLSATGSTQVLDHTDSYTSLDISGSNNGYSGITFRDVSGRGRGLMVHNTADIQGFYTQPTSQWSWYFQDGALTVGTIPVGRITGVLPISNGGTGTTSSTGSGSLVLSSSPSLTGTPTAPTPTGSSPADQIANKGYVDAAVSGAGGVTSKTHKVFPWVSAGTQDTAGAPTGVSNWTQITSSTGGAIEIYELILFSPNYGLPWIGQIQLATGASGSETIIGTWASSGGVNTGPVVITLPLGISVSPGQRLSFRPSAGLGGGASTTVWIGVHYRE